jgi:hypothetical protein
VVENRRSIDLDAEEKVGEKGEDVQGEKGKE